MSLELLTAAASEESLAALSVGRVEKEAVSVSKLIPL